MDGRDRLCAHCLANDLARACSQHHSSVRTMPVSGSLLLRLAPSSTSVSIMSRSPKWAALSRGVWPALSAFSTSGWAREL